MSQELYSGDTIEAKINLPDTITAVAQAFKSHARGDAQMPAKNYLNFSEYNGDLRSMPAYVPQFERATVKVVNAHPDNPGNHQLPTVMALIVVVDPRTGRPEAVLDGTVITSKRTAAAGAVATDRCTPESVTRLGIIGTGHQARDQLLGQLAVRDFDTVHVYDRDESIMTQFADWAKSQASDLQVAPAKDPAEVVESSQVVVSLTPSKQPLFEKVQELPDTLHVNAMGADAAEKREWPDQLLNNVDLIVDGWDQARHSGEISQLVEEGSITEESIQGELGELLLHPEDSLRNQTLFDSTGLAVQDTAAAHVFLESDASPDAEFDFLSL
jgi:alanine dehydrogenase